MVEVTKLLRFASRLFPFFQYFWRENSRGWDEDRDAAATLRAILIIVIFFEWMVHIMSWVFFSFLKAFGSDFGTLFFASPAVSSFLLRKNSCNYYYYYYLLLLLRFILCHD